MPEMRRRLLPADFRRHTEPLRERYGAQPWLTVASGAVAEGYRLAGMSNDEFAGLLRSQVEERGRLLLHLRRKPIMRLRAGFDGHRGVIYDKDGVLILHLHFQGGGSYEERQIDFSSLEFIDDPKITLPTPPASSLLVTGGMRRPLASVSPTIPRCLHPQSIFSRGVTHERPDWSPKGFTTVEVDTHWETLALMPREVSRELGLPEQLTLDQMPWMPEPHPVRRDPARVAQLGSRSGPSTAPGARKGPSLRLVASN